MPPIDSSDNPDIKEAREKLDQEQETPPLGLSQDLGPDEAFGEIPDREEDLAGGGTIPKPQPPDKPISDPNIID